VLFSRTRLIATTSPRRASQRCLLLPESAHSNPSTCEGRHFLPIPPPRYPCSLESSFNSQRRWFSLPAPFFIPPLIFFPLDFALGPGAFVFRRSSCVQCCAPLVASNNCLGRWLFWFIKAPWAAVDPVSRGPPDFFPLHPEQMAIQILSPARIHARFPHFFLDGVCKYLVFLFPILGYQFPNPLRIAGTRIPGSSNFFATRFRPVFILPSLLPNGNLSSGCKSPAGCFMMFYARESRPSSGPGS